MQQGHRLRNGNKSLLLTHHSKSGTAPSFLKHLRDLWLLSVKAHVFKLIILIQLMLSSKWKLRFCWTSQDLSVCKGKAPDSMAYHKNPFAVTILSLYIYSLTSGLLIVTINTGMLSLTILSTPWYLKSPAKD